MFVFSTVDKMFLIYFNTCTLNKIYFLDYIALYYFFVVNCLYQEHYITLDCGCYRKGANSSEICDIDTGRCNCLPFVKGDKCDSCEVGAKFFAYLPCPSIVSALVETCICRASTYSSIIILQLLSYPCIRNFINEIYI